jgi:hypothetical protein
MKNLKSQPLLLLRDFRRSRLFKLVLRLGFMYCCLALIYLNKISSCSGFLPSFAGDTRIRFAPVLAMPGPREVISACDKVNAPRKPTHSYVPTAACSQHHGYDNSEDDVARAHSRMPELRTEKEISYFLSLDCATAVSDHTSLPASLWLCHSPLETNTGSVVRADGYKGGCCDGPS